jgi:hypothetical protein
MNNPKVRRTRRHQRHREKVMRAQQGICYICGQAGADAIDHIVAVSWGGSDDISNLAPAHTSCNSAKGDARPEQWTYERPAMWLPGFGPRSSSKPVKKSGCAAYGFGIPLGIIVGGFVGALIGGNSIATLLAVIGCSMFFVWLFGGGLKKREARKLDSMPVATIKVAGQTAPPRNARGLLVREGYEADIAPVGDSLVRLPFTPSGVNVETFIKLLNLRSGVIGYRDGLVRMVDSYLEVNAMIRLAAQVESSGDDEVTAAPVGSLTAEQWREYPALGEGITMVQVALELRPDGSPIGHIIFLRSALA